MLQAGPPGQWDEHLTRPASLPFMQAGVSAASLVYLGIAITSYLALGNDAPGFVFDGYYDIPGERAVARE